VTRLPRLRTVSATLALAAVVAAGAGCGAHDDTIPFRRIPPHWASVPAVPRSAAPCAAPAARLMDAGAQGLNSAFNLYYLRVRNRGSHTCVIAGPPIVTVPGSQAIPVSVSFTSHPFGETRPWRVAVAPGRSTGTMLAVSHLCAFPLRQTTTVHYRVSLAGFAGINQSAVGCTTGTSIEASPFQPELRPRGGSHWPLRARLIVPRHAKGGTTLRLAVELTNIASRPFRFPYCPDYDLIGIAEAHSYSLNCRDVGTLQPGATVRFALETHVPRTDHRWRSELSFSTAPDNDQETIDAETSMLVVP